jgi:hypothetical protein
MEPESHLLVERRDGIMILTMNRPEVKNSLSPQMLVRLAAAWHEFRDSRELRVAILTGAGDEDFCAGGDLKLTMPLITGARKPEDEWDEKLMGDLQQFLDAILRGFRTPSTCGSRPSTRSSEPRRRRWGCCPEAARSPASPDRSRTARPWRC